MEGPFVGKNLDEIKEMNISAVIKRIYDECGISRTDLAESIGMSGAFVTKVLGTLVSCGVIEERRIGAAERGRPKVALSFNFDRYAMLGLRINNRYISSALCGADGEIKCHFIKNLDDSFSTERILDECIRLLKKAMSFSNGRIILGLGVAAPGPLPVLRDRITALNDGIFTGLPDVLLADYFRLHLGLKTVIWHDAYCGALNEYIFPSEECRYHNIAFLATDNGIGAGIIVGGRPFNGAGGFAGEVANMLLSVNGSISSVGKIASPREMLDRCGCKTIEECAERISAGDIVASEEFDAYIRALAVVAANLVVTVSPQAIVISDKITLLDDRVYGICRAFLDEHLPREYAESVEIKVRPYNKHSVLRGACGAVLHAAFEEPCEFFLEK